MLQVSKNTWILLFEGLSNLNNNIWFMAQWISYLNPRVSSRPLFTQFSSGSWFFFVFCKFCWYLDFPKLVRFEWDYGGSFQILRLGLPILVYYYFYSCIYIDRVWFKKTFKNWYIWLLDTWKFVSQPKIAFCVLLLLKSVQNIKIFRHFLCFNYFKLVLMLSNTI